MLAERYRDAVASSRLASLPEATLVALMAGSAVLDVPLGGVLLRLGSSDPFVCVVAAGLLRTFLVSADGRQMTVRYSRRGDIVGAATLFAGQLPSTVRPEPIAVSQRSMMFYISAGRSLQNSIECRNAPGELGMADAVMIPRLRWRQRSRC